jgi:molecular chaperone HscA
MSGLLQISEPGSSKAKAACKGRAVGIDLGTTHSLVACVRDGRPEVLVDGGDAGPAIGGAAGPLAGAHAAVRGLVPSVVHYPATVGAVRSEPLVGRSAQILAEAHPSRTFVSIKRFLGRAPNDVAAVLERTPYRLADDSPPARGLRFDLGDGQVVTPVEVSAQILFALRLQAEEVLGGPLDGAVITVPAYFDDAQRQATKDAAQLAGLEVLRLVAEPTAAALAYGLDQRSQGLFAVYDLGGGTFDLSILKLVDGVFEVLATAGDTALGGDDFDHALVDLVARELSRTFAGAAMRPLLTEARRVRESLSHELVARFEVLYGSAELDVRCEVTRSELEAAIAPVLERTGSTCRRALKDAGVEGAQLDGVILVGGTTRTPAVRAYVETLFGQPPLTNLDPDQVVALGAAVQAELLTSDAPREDALLLDVIPLSYGIETMGGAVAKILQRNSTLPAGATATFTTFADRQTGYTLHVVQGERELASECRSLAKFTLSGIPPMPAGIPRLEVTFLVDADGILRVTAKELTSGEEMTVKVQASQGLSEDEIERMLRESYEFAEEDMHRRALVEQRVDAEQALVSLRKALREESELLEPGELSALQAAAARLEQTKGGLDADGIRDSLAALDELARPFAERRMARAISQVAGHNVAEFDGAGH